MSTKVIINSDDYCRTSNISRGIREAHLRGVVSSTTCMMNFPNAEADLELALAETPNLGLGVHLVLTSGKPILPPEQLGSLVNAGISFPKLPQFLEQLDQVDPAEAKAEWRAQIEKFMRITGRTPTHLDSHHHSSYYTMGLLQAMLALAQEYGCAVRQTRDQESSSLNKIPYDADDPEYAGNLIRSLHIPTTDNFYASFYDDGATQENLLRILRKIGSTQNVAEIMCHPGYSDENLVASSSYNQQRERELKVLTDPEIRNFMQSHNMALVTFASLA